MISLAPDGSYAPLVAAIASLEAERKQCCVALAAGEALHPLTIVLDKLPDLVDEVSSTGDLLRKLSQMGRDLRMRVIALATSELVEDLGLKGRGHARRNFATVRLEPAQSGAPRIAMLQWGANQQALDLHTVPLLARRAQLTDRQWLQPIHLPAVSSLSLKHNSTSTQRAQVIASLVEYTARPEEESRHFSAAEGFQAAETHFTPAESDVRISEQDFSDIEIAQIAARIVRGEKKSKLVQAMPRYPGPKYAAYAAHYERLRQALDEAEED